MYIYSYVLSLERVLFFCLADSIFFLDLHRCERKMHLSEFLPSWATKQNEMMDRLVDDGVVSVKDGV